jgi:hypothetical protein
MTSRHAQKGGKTTKMTKQFCIIQANCQADGLVKLLYDNPQFNSRFVLRKYTNFLREPVPQEELSTCSVFIYQYLGGKWDELSSDSLLKQLNPKARVLRIPNMMFKGYWPFWTNQGPSEFGDYFLDQLIAMKLNKSEIMQIYLRGKLENKFDLAGMFEQSIEIERTKEQECIVKTVDWVLERYREEMVFFTINHPGMGLLEKVAREVYRELELPVPDKFVVPNLYDELTVPVHPQLGRICGIKFADDHARYNVFGKLKTCEQYVSNDIDSQLLDMRPLTAYLQLV